MKRLIDFSTLSLSLLILSTSSVKALENEFRSEEATQSLATSVLVAQAETSSQFVTVEPGHATTGTLNIIEENGKQYLELSDDFQTGEGPDVEIILHKDAAIPLNIKQEDYLAIAPIESLSGSQRYEIPAGIELNNFASVGIWCKEFNITFGYAQL